MDLIIIKAETIKIVHILCEFNSFFKMPGRNPDYNLPKKTKILKQLPLVLRG